MNDWKDKRREFKKIFDKRIYCYVLKLLRVLSKVDNNLVVIELKKQLIRSGTSIGANYFEAKGASTNADFRNFFSYALKSSNESKFWLALLRDCGLIRKDLLPEIGLLLKETDEIGKILAKSIITIKRNDGK